MAVRQQTQIIARLVRDGNPLFFEQCAGRQHTKPGMRTQKAGNDRFILRFQQAARRIHQAPARFEQCCSRRQNRRLPGGQLVANPIPREAEIPREVIVPAIEQALADAAREGIAAKAVTPFLLRRLFELTQGRSLAANIALVLDNARLAAQIAAEIMHQRQAGA